MAKLPRLVLCALLAFGTMFGAAPANPTAPAVKQEKKEAPTETRYWLTTKSQVRHNTKCRYYKNSEGRICPKDAGRACKICGG